MSRTRKKPIIALVVGGITAVVFFVITFVATRYAVSQLTGLARGTLIGGAAKANWQLFTSGDRHFQIKLPAAPKVDAKDQDSPTGKIKVHSIDAKASGVECGVVYFDLSPRDLDAIPLFNRFEGAKEGMLKQSGGKLKEERDIKYRGQNGREWIVDVPGKGVAVTRAYAIRKGQQTRFFIIVAGGQGVTKASKEVATLFDSFRVFSLPETVIAMPGEHWAHKRLLQVTATPDGKTLIVALGDGRWATFDAATGKKRTEAQGNLHDWPQCLAVMADGKTLAGATRDKLVQLWNLSSGKKTRQILWEIFNADCQCLAASPREALLALGNMNTPHVNRLYNVASAKVKHDFQTEWRIEAMAFSKDGKMLATAGQEMIQLWDTTSGTEIAAVQIADWPRDGQSFRMAVAVAPDGGSVALANHKLIQFFDIRKRLCTRQFKHNEVIETVTFSPDGKFVAAGDRAGSIWLWNAQTGKCQSRLILSPQIDDPIGAVMRQHPDRMPINSLFFLSKDKLVAGAHNEIQVWNLNDLVKAKEALPNLAPAQNDDESRTVDFERRSFAIVDFIHDDKTLITVTGDGSVRQWRMNPFRIVGTGPILYGRGFDRPRFITGAVAPKSNRIALNSERPGRVKIVELATGKTVETKFQEFTMSTTVFTPDGKALALSTGSRLEFVDPQTLKPGVGHGKRDFPEMVLAGAFRPDGKQMIVGGGMTYLELISAPDAKPLGRLSAGGDSGAGELGATLLMALTGDGDSLVTCDHAGALQGRQKDQHTLRLWNLADKKVDKHFIYPKRFTALSISRDAKWIAAAAEDGTLWLWDRKTGKNLLAKRFGQVRTPFGENGIDKLVFSPDGKYLILTQKDKLQCHFVSSLLAEKGQGQFDLSSSAIVAKARDRDGKLVLKIDTANSIGVHVATFFNDNKTLCIFDTRGGTQLWNADTGQRQFSRRYEQFQRHDWLAATPDGREVLFAPVFFAAPYFLNIETEKKRPGPVRGGNHALERAAFSADGKTFASGYSDGKVIFWDVPAWKQIGECQILKKKGITFLACAPDGRNVVVGNHERLQLIDVATQKIAATLPPFPPKTPPQMVRAVAFAPDSRRIAYASNLGIVRVWNLQSKKIELNATTNVFNSGANGANLLEFSPDGQWLLSPGEVNNKAALLIWNLKNGKRHEVMTGGKFWSGSQILFSRDGRHLVVPMGSTIYLWDTRTLFARFH